MVQENYKTDDLIPTLRDLIKQAGLKNVQLAQKIGVSKANISKYNDGSAKPSLDVFFAICRELKVNPLDLGKSLGMDVTGIPEN